MLFVALALLTASDADSALVTRSLDSAEAASLQAACARTYRCAPPERVKEAMADAVGLGISCADDDALCWRRFLAAEGFARVLVATRSAGALSITLVETAGDPRSGTGADAESAWSALTAPPAAPPADTPPADAPPADAPPAESGGDELAADAGGARSPVPFAIAGMSAALSLGTGVAAGFISASIVRSLDAAADGTVPLEGYNARNAAFFVCAGLSATAGVGALVALGAGLLLE